MKSDEDVWISLGTKASQPDESGPDGGSGVVWQRRKGPARPGRRKGGKRALNVTPTGVARGLLPWDVTVERGLLKAGSAGRLSACPVSPGSPQLLPGPRESLCEQKKPEDRGR